MLNARISVKGLDQAKAQLATMGQELDSFEPEAKRAGDYLIDFFTNDVFDSEGGVYGSPWQPLSPAYAAVKGGGQILVRSGKMRASYKLYTSSDYLLIRNEATNENGDYYARYHQDGGRVPQRILMKFDQQRLSEVAKRVQDSLNDRIQQML